MRWKVKINEIIFLFFKRGCNTSFFITKFQSILIMKTMIKEDFNMIKIRSNVFEVNFSSTHSIAIGNGIINNYIKYK